MAELPDLPDDGAADERRASEGDPRTNGHAADLAHWRELTAGEDLERTMLRLDEDEHVALERRTIERMRAGAVMLDLDRLLLAAAARITYHAPEYTGDRPLGEWLEGLLDQAIEDLVTEDAIEERDDRPVARDDPRYAHLALQLQTDPRTFRRGAVVFHRMPHEERAAFWAVFVDNKSIERHAAETHVPLRIAQRRFDRAVTTFCTLGNRRDPGDGNGPRKRGRGRR